MNTLRYDFSRHIGKDEWRGIHVPHANLRRVRLARLNFSGSGNFQNVQFQHAELAGTNFQGCETTDARFLSDAEKHHYVTRRPQAVTRYKNDTMDVITYAIPVASEEADHQIINLGLDGKKYPVIDGHKSKVLCMEWGIDGLISASKNGTIRFWSEKGDRIQTFKYDEKTPIYSLSWHYSGHIFASVGANGYFYLWNTRSSDPLMQREWVGGVLRRVLFGQSVLLVGGDLGKLHVWDYGYEAHFYVTTKRQIDFRHSIHSMAWSPRENSVAVGLGNGKIYLQKISAIQPSRNVLNGHRGGAVKSIAWHKNGDMLITGGEDGGIYTWSVTRKELLSIQYGDGTPIEQLCILADGRRVLAAQDRMLSIWETETATTKNAGYEDEITHRIKCIQAYDDRFATGHVDGSVIEWHANGSGQRVLTELYRHESPVELMILSPDQQYLVTSDALHTVSVFDRHTRIVQSMILPTTSAKIQDIHWIKDSTSQYYLALGTDQGILVWELSCTERRWMPRTMTYLTDTPCIASQRLGVLCAVADGATITILSYGPENIFRRIGQVFSVSSFPVVQLIWSSNDEWLAVMDESSRVYLFNVGTRFSQCLDEDRSQEKEMFWVNRDGKLRLLVSSLEEIKWVEVDERGATRFRKISSGTERLAIGENQYYLASKMSVDIMQLATDHLVYITRVGTGLCTRDANFTDVKVLREDESKALEVHGAIVPKSSWFNFSFFSREQVHPLPIRTRHTSLPKYESCSGLPKKESKRPLSETMTGSLDDDVENSSPSSSVQTLDIATGELSGKPSSPIV